ncbi:MAG: putative holin-like toxin [Limosilactobacillus sp.]
MSVYQALMLMLAFATFVIAFNLHQKVDKQKAVLLTLAGYRRLFI